MEQAPRRVPNPPGLRYAGILVVILSAFMGVSATMSASEVWSIPEARRALHEIGDPYVSLRQSMEEIDPGGPLSAMLSPDYLRGTMERRLDALEQMKGSRTFALTFLSIACMFAFIAAGRLLRQDGMPREGMRKVLAGALLLGAFFRTFAGAQDAALAQKMMRNLPELLGTVQNLPPDKLHQLSMVTTVVGGVWTAVMAGALVLLGQYFRSEKVKQVVALQDQQLGR